MQFNNLKISVLLVEDDEDDIRLFQIAVRNMPNITITHVATLLGAIHVLSRQPEKFDVVVADLGLPDALGLETVRRLSALHDWILVLSGNDNREAYEVIREGADSFVWKGDGFHVIRSALICVYERSRRKLLSKN